MPGIQQFDFSVNLEQALLWKYEGAARLQSLIMQKQAWYSRAQTQFWTDWYRDVFDLRTANDFGLTVWAIILGVPLVASTGDDGSRPVFGFDPYGLNFDRGNFGQQGNGSLSLSTEQKRLVLRFRYFQLVSDGCPEGINEFLAYIFGDLGPCYVLDGLDMTCEYVFGFVPDAEILLVLETFDILPRPAGVELRVLINPRDNFGFDPYYLNFDRGNFGS